LAKTFNSPQDDAPATDILPRTSPVRHVLTTDFSVEADLRNEYREKSEVVERVIKEKEQTISLLVSEKSTLIESLGRLEGIESGPSLQPFRLAFKAHATHGRVPSQLG
jgi:hypothetical protein